MTKIVATSDLHGFLPEIPECDILVVAGDISPIDYDRNIDRVMNWFRSDFYSWIMNTPSKHRLLIGGNHDFALERHLADICIEYPKSNDLKYLHDEQIEIDGIKFYGLPWIPNLQGWAFYLKDQDLLDKFDSIPRNTDIIISHSPLRGIVDNPIELYGIKQAHSIVRDMAPKVFIC